MLERRITLLELRTRLGELQGGTRMDPTTVRRLIQKEGLPWVPRLSGKGVAFLWSEVEAWILARDAAAKDQRLPSQKRRPLTGYPGRKDRT